MEVGGCGVLDMSRAYPKTLFGPMFYSWWNCPLTSRPGHDWVKAFQDSQLEMIKSIKFDLQVLNNSPAHTLIDDWGSPLPLTLTPVECIGANYRLSSIVVIINLSMLTMAKSIQTILMKPCR